MPLTVTIAAGHVLTGDADLGRGWVRFDPASGTLTATGSGEPPSRPDIELPTGVLAPGLVDAQVNGAFGTDLADADADSWSAVVQRLPTHGVTAFVPTFITAPIDELVAALRRYAAVRPALDALPAAARTLGVHVEGPFLAERRRGAHRLEHLMDTTPDAVAALIRAGADGRGDGVGGGALAYVTLAPERAGGLEAVRMFTEAGVRVSIGHSDADEGLVHAAADAGATLVTHLFNAQRPLHHRDPGVVGAALVDDRLTCGLIVDGHHVLAAAVRVAFAAAAGRVMLVTDAVAALGMPDGTYELGGEQVTVRAGSPPRRADGTIAGAAGRLDDAVGLAVAAGVPLRTAVEAATRVPAGALGRHDVGRIATGLPADLVWLAPAGDQPLRARATWIGGQLAHHDGIIATRDPVMP